MRIRRSMQHGSIPIPHKGPTYSCEFGSANFLEIVFFTTESTESTEAVSV